MYIINDICKYKVNIFIYNVCMYKVKFSAAATTNTTTIYSYSCTHSAKKPLGLKVVTISCQ